MFSIIICSRTEKIPSRLADNIEQSIGLDYELIIIDNSQNAYSIYEAYNIGIQGSNGEFLCFIHDDIFISTNNWGATVKNIFHDNPQAGLLGIAGGKSKSSMPSAWWESGENSLKLVQHYKNKPKELWNQGFDKSDVVEVAAIDGVFMVMRKDSRISFNENLKGFHNYDLCLSIEHHMLKKKILVTNKILLEHFSEGKLDVEWLKSTSAFHKIYKKNLPVIINPKLPYTEVKRIEYLLGSRFIEKLLQYKLYKEVFYWWIRLIKLKPKSKFHFRILKKLVRFK